MYRVTARGRIEYISASSKWEAIELAMFMRNMVSHEPDRSKYHVTKL